MFRVEAATLRPAQCMFTRSANGPFIDLGRDFDLDHDGRMYIKTSYARELGLFVGLQDPADMDALRFELDAANAEILRLEEELEQADGVINAIDVIESRDFRARKRPGRKPVRKSEDEEVMA